MKVFISYHRKDEKYRIKLENILTQNKVDYFAVPLNSDYTGYSHEKIKNELIDYMKLCEVVICIVGDETYSRPHVDHELNAALSGGPGSRKGLIALILESRKDPKDKLIKKSIPQRIIQNTSYVQFEKFGSFHSRIGLVINSAIENAQDGKIHIKNNFHLNNLRSKKYGQ